MQVDCSERIAAWQHVVDLTAHNPAAALQQLRLFREPDPFRTWTLNHKVRCLGFLGQLTLEDMSHTSSETMLREAAAGFSRQGDHDHARACLERALCQSISEDTLAEHTEQLLSLGRERDAAFNVLVAKQRGVVLTHALSTLRDSEDTEVHRFLRVAYRLPLQDRANWELALINLLGCMPSPSALEGREPMIRTAVALVLVDRRVFGDPRSLFRVHLDLCDNLTPSYWTVRGTMLELLDFAGECLPWFEVMQIHQRVAAALWREHEHEQHEPRSWVQISSPRVELMQALLSLSLRQLKWLFPDEVRAREQSDPEPSDPEPSDSRARLLETWGRIVSAALGTESPAFQWICASSSSSSSSSDWTGVTFPGLLPEMFRTLRRNLALVGVHVLLPYDVNSYLYVDEDYDSVFGIYCLTWGLALDTLSWDARFGFLMTAGLSQLCTRPKSVLGWAWDLSREGWSLGLRRDDESQW
jgi:hypothetical protein